MTGTEVRPVEGMLQTTVVDPSATDSDALSTVVFVLDPAASRRILASRPETQALIFRQSSSRPSCIPINWKDTPCRETPATKGTTH